MKIVARVPQIIVRPTRMTDKQGNLKQEQVFLLDVEGKLAPMETTIMLEQGQTPYGVGEYDVDGGSFSSGQYGRVEFRLRIGKQIEVGNKLKAA